MPTPGFSLFLISNGDLKSPRITPEHIADIACIRACDALATTPIDANGVYQVAVLPEQVSAILTPRRVPDRDLRR
jgi:hypothetical protein